MLSSCTVWYSLVCLSYAAYVASVTNEGSGAESEHSADSAPSWACSGSDEYKMQARFDTEYHWMCLRERNIVTSPLLAKNSIFYVDRKRSMILRESNISLVHGYTIGERVVGAADGYLDTNGQFVGMLHYKDRTLYADSMTNLEMMTTYRRFEHDYTPPPQGKSLWRQKRYDLDYDSNAPALKDESMKYDNESATQMSYKKPILSIRPTRTPKPRLNMTSRMESKMTLGKTTSQMTPPPGRTTRKMTSPVTSQVTFTTTEETDIALHATTEQERHIQTQNSDWHMTTESNRESSASFVPVYASSTKHEHKVKHKKVSPLARHTATETPGKARVCELLVMADHTYYVHDANSNLDIAIKRMFHAVSLVDMIFRNTDFDEDGEPDNIGFSVKYAMILTTMRSHNRLFGDLPVQPHQDGKDYLTRFAALRKLEDVCMGVAFTGYSFNNRSIGLSFTSLASSDGTQGEGGACERGPGGLAFNILAVAHGITSGGTGTRVPARMAGMALAHQMGHSFGAPHDDIFPQRECEHHLMGQHSFTGDKTTHYKFSYCSRQLMRITIENSASCLVYDDRPYCGNGIVEGDEACDCGLSANCAAMDRCCTPKAGAAAGFVGLKSVHVAGCAVAPSALCHPSQGRCCNRNCSFSDLSIDGLECSRMHDKCPCASGEERCPCGLGGECLSDGTCVAAECARLSLRECTCPHHGPGGALAAANRCGVCCALEGTTAAEVQCASAESAARRLLLAGRVLLDELRETDFNGPSVFFKICLTAPPARRALGAHASVGCAHVSLRAWYREGVCLAHGAVGTCAASGVCIPPVRPAANLYPLALMEAAHMELAQNQRTNELAIARSGEGVLTISFKYFIILWSYCKIYIT